MRFAKIMLDLDLAFFTIFSFDFLDMQLSHGWVPGAKDRERSGAQVRHRGNDEAKDRRAFQPIAS